MPDNEQPVTLLPPRPEAKTGWRRLHRIWSEYPTAPVELLFGAGNLLRGTYVAWPGNHEAVLHFPSSVRLALAIIMAAAGGAQVFACLYEWGKMRAACAIVLVGLLVYVGAIYANLPYAQGGPGQQVVLFYAVFAVGEYWVATRTPVLLPLARWFLWWRERDKHG